MTSKNFLTEEEAKSKWCVHSRTLFYAADATPHGGISLTSTSFNKKYHEKKVQYSKCIGSECMSWRWSITGYTSFGMNQTSTSEIPKEEWKGYCGLAGKP